MLIMPDAEIDADPWTETPVSTNPVVPASSAGPAVAGTSTIVSARAPLVNDKQPTRTASPISTTHAVRPPALPSMVPL